MEMKRPSSTITAATIASACVTAFWEVLTLLTAFEPTAALIGATITLAAGIVGVLTKEKVLLERFKNGG